MPEFALVRVSTQEVMRYTTMEAAPKLAAAKDMEWRPVEEVITDADAEPAITVSKTKVVREIPAEKLPEPPTPMEIYQAIPDRQILDALVDDANGETKALAEIVAKRAAALAG